MRNSSAKIPSVACRKRPSMIATCQLLGMAVLLNLLALGWCSATVAEESESSVRLLNMVKVLAADEMEGRGVGTRGLDMAAEYIAEQFREIGLKTDLFDGTPFQMFTIGGDPQLGPVEDNSLVIQGPKQDDADQKKVLRVREDFEPMAIGGSGEVTAPLVFVGYGITAKDWGYDDYANVDVQGKVVLMLRKEPQQSNAESVFNGSRTTQHATFNSKVTNAMRHGAAAVIMVNDDYEVQQRKERLEKDWREAVAKLTEAVRQFAQQGLPGDADVKEAQKTLAELAVRIDDMRAAAEEDQDELPGVGGAGVASNKETIPVFFCRRNAVDQIVKQALGIDLVTLEHKIDVGPTPQSQSLEGWTAECQSNIVRQDYRVKNVVGVLEGTGPLADETIVVGAHYDHVGFGGRGSLARGSKDVHNGADDNASGTAAMIELAQRLAARSAPSRRRLVFVAFAGEESGLLGSAHYVKQPPYPLEKTVLMVNLDMIGRLTDNQLTVGGTGTAEEFDALLDQLNESYQFALRKQPQGRGPSDHASFYRHDIPVLFLFTGLHADYHRPTDDYDKINLDGMVRVTDLVADIVDSLDDAPQRLTFQKATGKPRFRIRPAGPFLGVMPDVSWQEEGFAIMSVVPDSPAAAAGLQAGDVIIRLGDEEIAARGDIAGAIRKYGVDKEVALRVLRKGEELTLKVVFKDGR